jgi:hypothetical protein
VAMPQAKKRQAVLIATILVIVLAVAIFVTADAWILVLTAVLVLVMNFASPVDDTPDLPNSPFKVWFFVAGACGGVALIVLGDGSDVAVGVFLLVLTLPALWMVRQGRNPWWMRGWADYSRRR